MARKYAIQSRVIKVTDPVLPGVVLFEAHVRIVNMKTDLVKKITGVHIDYELMKSVN